MYWTPGRGAELAAQWSWVILAASAMYIPVAWLLKQLMEFSKPLRLRTLRFAWNATLSVLSLYGLLIIASEDSGIFYRLYKDEGAYGPRTRMVVSLFCLTKAIEFGDTLWLILEKRKTSFLHLFHHLTVALYCLHAQWVNVSFAHLFVAMNLLVHGIMYGYFALATLESTPNRRWNFLRPYITGLQLTQMVVGLGVAIAALYNSDVVQTRSHTLNAQICVALYTAYAALFCSFYLDNYHKEFRSGMSTALTFAHLFAVVGAIRIYYHASWRRLLLETVLWYVINGFGVTCGAHRLWAHQSYKAAFPFRFFLMLLNSCCCEGTIFHWSRDHRLHHQYSEKEPDPHNAARGFWYSHCGWLFMKKPATCIEAGKKIDVSDLLEDPVVRLQEYLDPYWNLSFCFLLPSLYGLWQYGDFWLGFFTVGCLRWILLLHATWCVNSVAHLYGARPYEPGVGPAESWFTAIVADGEGWHNWHHFYPRDYAASECGALQQYNPSKVLIDAMAAIGQVWDRKRFTEAWERKKAERARESEEALIKRQEELQKNGEQIPSLTQYAKAIPAQTSNFRATLTLMRDLIICGVIAGAAASIFQFYVSRLSNVFLRITLSIIIWAVYWVAQGTAAVGVWLIGYECSCGRFNKLSAVNHLTGLVLSSFCLTPYKPRRAYREKEKQRAYLSWSLGLDAFAIIKVASWGASVIGSVGMLSMIYFLYTMGGIYGGFNVFVWYFGPWLVLNTWLVIYYNLLEGAPLSNGIDYDKPVAEKLDSSLLEYFTYEWLSRNIQSLPDSKSGWPFFARWIADNLHHHLPQLNISEAVDFRIPHYHAREAAKAVAKIISNVGNTRLRNTKGAPVAGLDGRSIAQAVIS